MGQLLSIRSVYYMLVRRREQHDTALRNNAREWMSLWKVKVRSKIRIFLWRLAKHLLPTGDVLHHRKMAQCSACFFCGMDDSWRHSLLECTMARCIWALEKEETVELLSRILENDAKSWLAIMTEILPQEEVVRVAIMLWAIWYA